MYWGQIQEDFFLVLPIPYLPRVLVYNRQLHRPPEGSPLHKNYSDLVKEGNQPSEDLQLHPLS